MVKIKFKGARRDLVLTRYCHSRGQGAQGKLYQAMQPGLGRVHGEGAPREEVTEGEWREGEGQKGEARKGEALCRA